MSNKTIEQLEEEIKSLKKQLSDEKSSSAMAALFDINKIGEVDQFNEIADTNMISVITDKNLIIKSVSKAFCETFGYAPSDLIGQNYNLLVSNKDAQKFYNGCDYVSTHGKEAWGTDFGLISSNDTMIYTHTIIYPHFLGKELDGFTFVSHNISDQYILNRYKLQNLSKEKFDVTTLEFMKSTGVAILNTINSKVSLVVKIISFTILLFFFWSVLFEIDEVVKGEGKIIPTSKVQQIRNLEGGVVQDITIKEGDRVRQDQVLIKIDDISYKIKLNENKIRLAELKAKAIRLKAQGQNLNLKIDKKFEKMYPSIVRRERSFFNTSKEELKSKIAKFNEQLKYQKSVLEDVKNSFLIIEENYLSMEDELEESKSLAAKGVFSKYEIVILERKVNDMLAKLVSSKEKKEQTKNLINEIKNSIKEAKLVYQNRAKDEYSKVTSEISKLKELEKTLKENIKSYTIKAPVDGTVKELFINTIGSSVNPSEVLMTIVPNNTEIISEIKILPENIGKLFVGQRLSLKVSAYDYVLYGNLVGEIINISPDTIVDKRTDETYYLVQVKTKRNYLDNNKKNKLKVGMLVSADILVGKKTILAFILKPILRSVQKD